MSANSETIYLKIERNVLVFDRQVTLGDIASITSSNEPMLRQLKQKKIYSFKEPEPGKERKSQQVIFSILKIVESIHEDYPNAEVENEGEADFIIEYIKNPGQNQLLSFCKTAILCLIVFFGGAFTIMSFNNDIGITDLFEKLYFQVMGMESNGMTELEFSYCIGLSVGILVFFNHIGKKKITSDPTPIQVQLRKYEQEVDDTYIENSGRGGDEIDVS